jgi:ABC-2 type transport system ATP-binding protein
LIALDTPARLRAGMREPILEIQTDKVGAQHVVPLLQGQPGVIEAAMFGRAVHVTVSDVAESRATLPALPRSHGIDPGAIREIPPRWRKAGFNWFW